MVTQITKRAVKDIFSDYPFVINKFVVPLYRQMHICLRLPYYSLHKSIMFLIFFVV